MKFFTKKRAAIIMSVIAALAVTTTSLAVFTDRLEASTSVTAGTLDLDLSQNWQTANADVIASFKPGTGIVLNYTVTNNGNLATDIKETFAVTLNKAPTSGNPEFDLYPASAVTVNADGTVKVNDATKACTATVSGNKITYALRGADEVVTVNGTGTDAETVSGITTNVLTGNYVLVFNTDVTNDFQNVGVTVEYLAQGLQHNNTGVNTWNDVKVISETFTFADSSTMSVVPVNP